MKFIDQIEQQQQEGPPAPAEAPPAPSPAPAPNPNPSPPPAPSPAPGTGHEVKDTTAPSLFDAEGKLVAGSWSQNEALKGFNFDKYAGKTPEDILKSLGNAEKLISQKGGVLTVPDFSTAKADDPAVVAFREQNGIPADPAAYVFKPDAQFFQRHGLEAGDWSEADALGYAKIAHKYGLTPAQAKGAAAEIAEMQAAGARRAIDHERNQLHEAETALKTEWGPAYKGRMDTVARMVIAQGGSLDAPGLRDPATVKLLYSFADLMGPTALESIVGAKNSSGGYLSGRDEAKAIMTDKNHPDHERYRNGDPVVVAKVRRLNQS